MYLPAKEAALRWANIFIAEKRQKKRKQKPVTVTLPTYKNVAIDHVVAKMGLNCFFPVFLRFSPPLLILFLGPSSYHSSLSAFSSPSTHAHTCECRDASTAPPLIVAIDLQPMAPIEGVVLIQGDITSTATAQMVSPPPPRLPRLPEPLAPTTLCTRFCVTSARQPSSLPRGHGAGDRALPWLPRGPGGLRRSARR